jgi:hypothetical protein
VLPHCCRHTQAIRGIGARLSRRRNLTVGSNCKISLIWYHFLATNGLTRLIWVRFADGCWVGRCVHLENLPRYRLCLALHTQA